jgi:hypothetical protein
VISTVEVIVPPDKLITAELVIPAKVDVPPVCIKEPVAFIVISPETVNDPPVVTVIVAPVPEELMFTVVMVTVLLMIG